MELKSSPTLAILLGLTLATVGIILGGLVRGESSLNNYFELKKSRQVLAKTVESLEQQNDALNQEILRLKQSSSYAKKVLRDKYHVTEPDEKIVFFAD